jgi:hypothetical protein
MSSFWIGVLCGIGGLFIGLFIGYIILSLMLKALIGPILKVIWR